MTPPCARVEVEVEVAVAVKGPTRGSDPSHRRSREQPQRPAGEQHQDPGELVEDAPPGVGCAPGQRVEEPGQRPQGEEQKLAIRNERRDAKELLDQAEKDGDISADEAKKAHDKVQKETDDGVKKVDEMVTAKEKEVMTV